TRVLRRILSNDQTPLPSASIFVNISRVVIWAVGVSVVLSSFFGVDVSAAITALGIGGIALSLGFQDTISNLIGGLQVSIMGIIKPGDYVDVSGQRGVVHDITWRHTTIEDRAGNTYIVPNAVINKSSVVKLPPENKLVIPLSVTTEGDRLDETVSRIVAAARQSAEKLTEVQRDPSVSLNVVTEFGFGGSLVVWVAEDADVVAVKDAVVRAVAPLTRREPAEE
ncbi:MAG: mechanosensitive ion channel, partial [Eggerthellaceae bacterium]|nr:mechanosensitive ion channel [Eggerthellaceae bacterium]